VLTGQLQAHLLFDLIVREATAIFDVAAVALVVPAAPPARYLPRASFGLSDDYLRKSTVADEMVRPDYPLFIPDLLKIEALGSDQIEYIKNEDLRTLLCIPINKADQHLAGLLLYTKHFARRFSEEEIELAQLFAGQAAVALENARLFAEVEERVEDLAKANKLKSEFLARVSHELRTPMNSINGYSEMLLMSRYGEVNEKQTDRLERILRNGKNLLALIDDLLDISKIDAGKMELKIEPLVVTDELHSTIESLESQATAHGLYLHSEVPTDLPLVLADSRRLKQSLVNLIGNAIKFTKTGGITVEAGLSHENMRPMVYLRIIDTGIGIRPVDQAIIFDEFRQVDGSATREYGGTGLGLAITRRLVEMMEGRVWVESEFGRGSAFTVALPVAVNGPTLSTPSEARSETP